MRGFLAHDGYTGELIVRCYICAQEGEFGLDLFVEPDARTVRRFSRERNFCGECHREVQIQNPR